MPLGEWVLHEALRQMAEWHRAGAPQACVAVNVSSLQLRRPGLDRKVQDALARSGHLGSSLCLELTETAIMETGLQVTRSLQAIKEMGVRLALDDFGTGYSSLSYLRRFPIDELKVDRSFVSECGSGTGSAAVITQAVIAMAHGLGLTVVAEGIETEQQLAYLRMHACDQFQGYLYSRPVPAAEFAALLSRGHAASTERERRAPQAVAAPRLPSIDQGLSTMEPVVLRASSSRWDSATSASA